jgi:opacity protein-like surface antigen
MTRNEMTKFLTTGVVLLMVFVVSPVVLFGQTAEPVQIAANTPVAAPTLRADGDVTPSTSALQARIDAQQRQIDQLNALVQKLQAMMDPVASTHPVLPSTRTAVVGFMTGGSSFDPSPSPSPSPAPSPAPAEPGYTAPRELLPDIGHIGAELGFFAGGSTNPYKADKGFFTGGYIDLPWKKIPGGKLSYEIMIGLQRSVTTTQTTSGVNVLVNAALNSYLGNVAGNETSPTNFLAGPLPITSLVEERAKVLTVAPFELKYTVTKLGRFRPYVLGGLGAYVWIGSDNNSKTFDANAALGDLAGVPVGKSTLGATLNALLQGSQIGGLAPTAPELAARGVPHGQGNLLFGAQFGGGAEIRITPKLSIGADFRRNQVEGKNASFNTFAFKQGLHW